MEKIPMHLILSKNRPLSLKYNLWYMPYCPVDIDNVDEWHDKITTYIDSHSVDYNILYIPDSIYSSSQLDNKEEKETKHLFVVGIGDNNSFVPMKSNTPDGYHVMYCLKRNISFDNNSLTNKHLTTEEEATYDSIFHVMFVVLVAIVMFNLYVYIASS